MNTFIKNLILTGFLCAATGAMQAQGVAYIQIAHNCADPSLDTLDLYFNGAVMDSNVVYHSATGLFSYQADTAFTIGIAYKHSNGNPYDSVRTFTFSGIPDNKRHGFIISGVNGSSFAVNPNGLSTGISIQEIADLDSVAVDTGHVAIRFFQGVTDLPVINIIGRNGGPLFVHALEYGHGTTDVSIRHTIYEFQVISQDSTQNYGTFSANLSGLGGQAIIILGSGFLNTTANNSGPAFGLYALLNTGAVITLPLELAGFQLLHNCADPAADSLDIYVNGQLAFAKLGFRNATPAILFNAYATYDVGIAHKNSTSVNDTFWHYPFFFPRDTFFIATASGLLSQSGFAPNPNGISTAFNVLIKEPAEFTSASPANFDFYMINGVTDAPPLNLIPGGGPVLLSNVSYNDQTNYISLPSEFYVLNVQDTSGNTLMNGFANFLAFTSQSGVLLTSGFLNPSANNNGAALGLFMAPTTGGPFIPLYSVTGVNNITASAGQQIFPNPASNQLHVRFHLPQPEMVSLYITDINGSVVQHVFSATTLSGAQNIIADVSNLAEGLYFSRLITSSGIINSRFVIVR